MKEGFCRVLTPILCGGSLKHTGIMLKHFFSKSPIDKFSSIGEEADLSRIISRCFQGKLLSRNVKNV